MALELLKAQGASTTLRVLLPPPLSSALPLARLPVRSSRFLPAVWPHWHFDYVATNHAVSLCLHWPQPTKGSPSLAPCCQACHAQARLAPKAVPLWSPPPLQPHRGPVQPGATPLPCILLLPPIIPRLCSQAQQRQKSPRHPQYRRDARSDGTYTGRIQNRQGHMPVLLLLKFNQRVALLPSK